MRNCQLFFRLLAQVKFKFLDFSLVLPSELLFTSRIPAAFLNSTFAAAGLASKRLKFPAPREAS